VELFIADNGSDRTQAATAASRLVEQDNVIAVIGSWGSSLSMAGGPIFEEAQIPAIGASCTNPLVTRGMDFYFRVCFIDSFQGKVLATYAYEELGARTAAVVLERTSDYSVGLANFFADAFVELTGDPSSIVSTGEYSTGDTDFNAQLTNIAQLNPDVIFAPGNFTESALILSQAKQLGLEQPFLGGDTWKNAEFINVGGEAVNGALFSSFPFDVDAELSPIAQQFVDAFRDSDFSEGGTKYPADVTALAFDAYNLLLDTIEKVGNTDGVQLRDALAATAGWMGVTGEVTFDENGDVNKAATIKQVIDGRFRYLTTVEPE
jgi:branched-chain amino acid transport system substrate-binding protein